MKKKYELIESGCVDGEFRIMSLCEFMAAGGRIVNIGELGGFVEGEHNLSHEGRCWIFDDAAVIDGAVVQDDATVQKHALVKGNAIIKNFATVTGCAVVTGDAIIKDFATVTDANVVSGHSSIGGMNRLSGNGLVEDMVMQ